MGHYVNQHFSHVLPLWFNDRSHMLLDLLVTSLGNITPHNSAQASSDQADEASIPWGWFWGQTGQWPDHYSSSGWFGTWLLWWFNGDLMVILWWLMDINKKTGWWFGTWLLFFSYIENNPPNWRTQNFQRDWNHQPVMILHIYPLVN